MVFQPIAPLPPSLPPLPPALPALSGAGRSPARRAGSVGRQSCRITAGTAAGGSGSRRSERGRPFCRGQGRGVSRRGCATEGWVGGHRGRAATHPTNGPVAGKAERGCQPEMGRITRLTPLLGEVSYVSSCSSINYRGCPGLFPCPGARRTIPVLFLQLNHVPSRAWERVAGP